MSAQECVVCHLPIGGRSRQHHDCPFCGRMFSRVDGAKRHIKTCPSRGSRPIPEDAKRGRKRHACDMCSKVKVSCDSKSPCSRCSSRKLRCTYARFCTDPTHLTQSKQAMKQQSTKAKSMKLPFLLACTDPNLRTVDEVILTGEPERDVEESASQVNHGVPSGIVDPNLLFLGFMDPYFGTEMEFNAMNDGILTPLSLDLELDEALFHTQVSLLETELHQTVAAENTRAQKDFDPSVWMSFFTPQNFRECINIFFRRDQLLATIIHKPTFHSDKVDATLLLAIVISGYSYIHTKSKKGFNSLALPLRKIAEEYIFHHVEQFLSPTFGNPDPQRALELCQAAYIIVTLQSCVKDANIRQRVITRCHPMLVTLLRNLDAMGLKHNWADASDWEDFVYKESYIRLLHWTFINDAWFNFFSNYPPAMTLLDMSGDLPCQDTLWAMEDQTSFNDARPEKIQKKMQHICLKSLMSNLLGNEWTPQTAALCKQLDVKHFLVTVFAFQHVIFQFESALLPENGLSAITQGLERWTDLWESALSCIDPEQRESLGLVRYSTELSFLLKRIIELKKNQEGSQFQYLERRVVYDTTVLRQLIQHCNESCI